MLFNTVQYILFLPIVVLIYYVLPEKVRYIWLFGVSLYFYMQWNPIYIVLLLSCITITYAGGLIIEYFKNLKSDNEEEQRKNSSRRKICLIACILLSLGILMYFKYFSMGISLLNRILTCVHLGTISWEHDILLPVGISFYTLQALGYLIDVYRGDIYAEKNFVRYALFVSFFPQLVAGPIERSQNLLIQLRKPHAFQYENLQKGLLLVL